MKLIKFKKEHLECMDIRDHEKHFLEIQGIVEYLVNSIAVTAILDGRVVCCGGVSPFAMGNAEIWLLPSIYLPEYKKTLCRAIKTWLLEIRDTLSLRRMQTDCLDDDLHNSWMEFLGFDREGTRKKYFNEKDYGVWGKVWE